MLAPRSISPALRRGGVLVDVLVYKRVLAGIGARLLFSRAKQLDSGCESRESNGGQARTRRLLRIEEGGQVHRVKVVGGERG